MNLRKMVSVLSLCLSGAIMADASIAEAQTPLTDNRRLVEMPAEAQQLLRQDMRDHLLALSEILGHLANEDFSAAAEVAEQRLGNSARGRHRGAGIGPGKFMPNEMRQIGHSMHNSASRFAEVAESGDAASRYSALQAVVASCTACHSGFRIR